MIVMKGQGREVDAGEEALVSQRVPCSDLLQRIPLEVTLKDYLFDLWVAEFATQRDHGHLWKGWTWHVSKK